MDDALREAGKAFNAMKDERTAADYDETIVPSPEQAKDAKDALQAAANFLALCGSRFGFRRSAP